MEPEMENMLMWRQETYRYGKRSRNFSGLKTKTGLMKKVNKQCLLDTPRTVRVSEKTFW